MVTYNLYAAWLAFLGGIAAGAIEGLFFYREDWRGGYTSWRRRLTRLAHISFFGIGLLNLGYASSVRSFDLADPGLLPSILFIIALIGMPLTCYLAAWKKQFRHLFCIPVACLTIGIVLFLGKVVQL